MATDLIDGKTPLEVLKLQKRHLDILQKVPPGKPLLIKAIEGSTEEGQDSDLYGWRDFTNNWHKVLEHGTPIYTRGILRNEIVFDPDVKDWDIMKEHVGKLKSCLDLHNVPYELAYSGGKACHLHIFLDTFDIDTADFNAAKVYDVDAWKCVRETIVKELLKLSGADPDKMGLDWGKIRFDISKDSNGRNGKGSQIREYGTTRPNGKYKTLVDEIPETNPDYLPLRFPGQPKLWNISGTTFHQAVRDAFKVEVDRARVRNEYNLTGVTFEDTDIGQFPCYQKIKALHLENGRYYAVAGMGLLSKMCGHSREETGQILTDLLNTFKGLSSSDKQLRLDNSLKMFDTDKHFSCRKLKEMVGAHVCDFTRCPLKEKIQSAKEQKPIDWKTPLKQAVMDTQDADQEAKIRAAKDILFNVLADMTPIARRETFLECVCKDLKLSNRAANDIYKNFEINTNPLNKCEWFTEKGKFVPPVMSDQIRGQYHFITLTDTKEIWVYDDKTGCYKPGGDVVIKQYAQQALDTHSKKSHVEETVYHIMNETFEDRSVFGSNPECINLQNGIYNIRTCVFEDHRPSVMFTYALPFKYDPNAVCSKFDELLTNCGVNKTLIYEIFAYCLVPGYPIQSLFIFSGDGGNGKGTVIRVLRRFLGEENIVGHSMQALEKNRYALADLFGKLANICGDMPPTDVRDTSPIKTTTGGDAITAPVIYKGNITFENRAKMIFLLNHLPEFDDNTDSFDRRLVFQEFNNRVVGLDENFNEADLWTEEELSGIFNQCLQVLPNLLPRGTFTGQMGIEETKIYRQRKGNPIAAFVDDCTNYDDMQYSSSAETYAAYLKWCTENHETCLTENVFGRKLLEKFPEFKKSRRTIDGSRVYCYNGFVLKEGYKGLNILEEVEKNEELEEPVQDTQGMSRIGPGTVQDKNSVFSDTIDGNGVFGLGCSPKLSLEKNKNENDKEKDNANFLEEDVASILDTSQKEATDNESILDGSWTDPGPNPDRDKVIEEALDLWEKTACPIFAKNAHKAKLDIVKYHRVYGINPQLIYEAVDKRAAGRCVDCGADSKDHGTSDDGKRCKTCYNKMFMRQAPAIPKEICLEDPAEVVQ